MISDIEPPKRIEKLTDADVERLKQIQDEVRRLRDESIKILEKTQFNIGKDCKKYKCPYYDPHQRTSCYKDCCHKLFQMNWLPRPGICTEDPLPDEAYEQIEKEG